LSDARLLLLLHANELVSRDRRAAALRAHWLSVLIGIGFLSVLTATVASQSAAGSGVGPNLSLDRVRSTLQIPPRLHLERYTEDQAGEVERLLALGAGPRKPKAPRRRV